MDYQNNALELIVDNVLPYVKQVASVVANKNSLPILDNIRITADKTDVLRLKASDNETWLEATVLTNVNNVKMDCCVNAKALVTTLSSLSGQIARLTTDEKSHLLIIHYGTNNSIKLPYKDGSEFIDEMELGDETPSLQSLTINAKSFLAALQRTQYAVSNDELRPIMMGVRADFNENGLECAASDGRKLSYYADHNFHLPEGQSADGFVLPSKPLSLLVSILQSADYGDELKLTYTGSQIRVEYADELKITTRLVVGNYPAYKRVIPNDNNNILTVNKKYILDVLNRILLVANMQSKLVRMSFRSDGIMRFSTEDIDYSMGASEELDKEQGCSYTGIDFEIGFQGDFLIQTIKNIASDAVAIKFGNNNSKAAIFSPSPDPDGTEHISILMPLLLQ